MVKASVREQGKSLQVLCLPVPLGFLLTAALRRLRSSALALLCILSLLQLLQHM